MSSKSKDAVEAYTPPTMTVLGSLSNNTLGDFLCGGIS
jgi:hypothetical protein